MSARNAHLTAPKLRVIEPKLMLPRIHPGTVRRDRLLEMLDDGGAAPLTLVAAGVGYGKTMLLRSWCAERPESVIWMTLDAADDEPARLWTHLATAVERLGDGLGRPALSALNARGASIRAAVDEVINGLVGYERPVTIVLDDLHCVKGEESLRSLAHATQLLPANARLLVSTRSDPPIGLGRLRASRALNEIRARELAFTAAEAAELLAHEEIHLSPESFELLVERTEGWPAGLYLAALWLRDHKEPDHGVRTFAGSARHVGEYLADEALNALAPQTRGFLERTSVLGRFTPELCDAVLTRDDSAAVLAELARSNMFLVALNSQGEWYRYHHLFREVVQLEVDRDVALQLRRRAAAWCRGHGLVEDAIEYAAAAGDHQSVCELLVDHHLEFIWGGRLGQFLGWIRWLPPALLAQHPLLAAAGAATAALLAHPEIEIQRLLGVAERARDERPDQWSPYLEAAVELIHAEMMAYGDVSAAVNHGRRAVIAARAGADTLSVASMASLAHALYFAGDLDETRRVATEAIQRPDAEEVPDGYVASLGLLSLVDAEQGRPERAEGWARQAIDVGRQRLHSDSWIMSLAHLGLALACAATDRPDEAEREAERGERRRRAPQPTIGHAHALLVLAQVRLARSRLAPATRDLARAQRAIAEFADPGRLPALATVIEHDIAATRAHAGARDLVESPSPAELAVLRGLAAGLSRREVGDELYISLNTVKTHVRELYRKLGAASQAQAVARAEALGLLTPAESPG